MELNSNIIDDMVRELDAKFIRDKVGESDTREVLTAISVFSAKFICDNFPTEPYEAWHNFQATMNRYFKDRLTS